LQLTPEFLIGGLDVFYGASSSSVETSPNAAPVSTAFNSLIRCRNCRAKINTGINYGAVVEFTLRNGRHKLWKDLQFGLQTGDPRTFATYDDLWNAFRAQLLNCVRHCMVQVYTALALKPDYIAAPLCSMLHDLAMEHGRDLHTHGATSPARSTPRASTAWEDLAPRSTRWRSCRL
jgi:formate C-acetyltransferase